MQQRNLRPLNTHVQDGLALEPSAPATPGVHFFQALGNLVRRPQRILFLWNWKAAWLSIILRGPVFLGVTIRRGFRATFEAILVECVFCMSTAGFYGAFVQTLRDAEPEWLTIVFLTLILPAAFQVLEFLMHQYRGTPHLLIAEMILVVASGISALFNWYAMRRGVLLVGGEGGSFGSDLRRLPVLLLKFVAALPSWIRARAALGARHKNEPRKRPPKKMMAVPPGQP